MSKDDQVPKLGSGHADAMFRQGLAELRSVFYADSNVAQPGQYGLYGTLTPGEVAEARRDVDRDADEEPTSVLDERLEELDREAPSLETEPETHEPDRE